MTRRISAGAVNTGAQGSLGVLQAINNTITSPPEDIDIVLSPNGTGVTEVLGNFSVNAGDDASSTTTGTVIVNGGMGISGALNVGGFTGTINGTLIGIDPATPSTAVLTNFTSTGLALLDEIIETANTKSSASGTVVHDFSTGGIWIHSSITANFTVNLTNVPTDNNRQITVSLVLIQGGTGFLATALQIDGTPQTLYWPAGQIARAQANKLDIQTFTLTRSGSVWYVESSLSSHGSLPNGSSNTQPATSVVALGLYQNTSGTYWIQTPQMASAQQYYVDFDVAQGPWARIFLANTDNYNTTSYSWDNGQTSNMLRDLTPTFRYCFVNTADNSSIYNWSFRLVGDQSNGNWTSFRDTPPMGHGGTGAPLITQVDAVRLSTGEEYRSYLRTGVSSFGNQCDDNRSGNWGQICLKYGNTQNTGTGGYSDFPHYSSYTVSNTDNWAQSNQSYNTNSASSSRRFAVYVR